jgi:hypothetical protein
LNQRRQAKAFITLNVCNAIGLHAHLIKECDQMSTETWYVLEDESVADPSEIALKDGRLQHKDGRAVAYAPHGPRTRSVDADAERAKAVKRVPRAPDRAPAKSSEERQSPSYERRDMKPEASAQPYKTREMKSN